MAHEIPAPMLAKSVANVPDPQKSNGGLSFEPKWDGYRVLVSWDGETVELGSRGAKPLTRYFPELVDALPGILPGPCLIDGEIVIAVGEPGAQQLSWETLSQRIHPAASRVQKLAAETPAMIVAFDLLSADGESLLDEPFRERRERLESLLAGTSHPLYLTRETRDPELARRWLEEFEGAGLDGIVAKPLDAPYAPGKRAMFKVKHARTADVVALGYRVHKSGSGVGSILVGLYDADGVLRNVGGVSAFSDKRRQELVTELEPYVERDENGDPVRGETDRSRFASGKDVSFVSLRPERVIEVNYDQLEGHRFRHTVQFSRWRDDRDPRSCTYDQLDVPAEYDLGAVLASP